MEYTINKSSESFSNDSGLGTTVIDRDGNSSEAIETYKQRLLMKESLLSSFTSNYNIGDDIESSEQRTSVHIKFMPAYLYVYKKQYILFPNANDRELIENYYNEIILLSDINIPSNIFLQNTQNSNSKSSSINVNLISQTSIKKHIYRKIVECNKPPQINKSTLKAQSPSMKLKQNQKILKSQYCVALKLLLQQYRQSCIFILSNLLIGLVVVITSFFVLGYSNMINNNGEDMSIFDIFVSIYYLIAFLIISILLYKSALHSSFLSVKINKYASYFFLFSSLLNFGLIFLFDEMEDLQIVTIFGTTFILLFIFHVFQSIKLYNLYLRLEVLLGIRLKEKLIN